MAVTRFQRWAFTLGGAVLMGCMLTTPVGATEISSNLGSPESFDPVLAYDVVGSPGNDVDWAVSFTTPTREFALDSIELAVRLDAGLDDTIDVVVAGDDGAGRPGDVLESMSITGVTGTASIRFAFSASGLRLVPNTLYWVSLSAPGDASIAWHQNDGGDVGPMATRSNGGAWIVFQTNRGAFRVNATLVPEMFKDQPRVTSSGGTRTFSTHYTCVATTGMVIATPAPGVPSESPNSANYEMSSGYWHVAESPVLPDGDVNLDNMSDGDDVQAFIEQALLGVGGDPFVIPHADYNCDGVLDSLDIPLFADRLLRSAPPNAANTVFPIPGAMGVSIEADLAWAPGDGAVAFNVYLGTMEDAVLSATTMDFEFEGETSGFLWEPGQLTPSTVYYWRIDSVDQFDRVSTGTVWSFRTGP